MRRTKRPVFVVAFLLMLYISPAIFISSYASSTIPTEQNTTKEFAPSAYLDESPYSIDGFSETLPDDELFFPDGVNLDDPVLASNGGGNSITNDWYDTFAVDNSSWSTFGGYSEYIMFQAEFGVIEGFDYAFYARSIGGTGSANLTNHDGDFIISIAQDANYTWYNGSYKGDAYSEIQVYFLAEQIEVGDAIQFDYMQLAFHVMSKVDLSDNPNYNHWGESFWNVSDWVVNTGNTVTTNGDVASLIVSGDDSYDISYSDAPNFASAFNHYVEIRHKENVTVGTEIRFYFRTADNGAGSNTMIVVLTPSTTWITEKSIISSVLAIESVSWYAKCSSAGVNSQLDYLRISPANEMGWQHDASTTEGVTHTTSANMAFTESTDGDILTLNATMTTSFSSTYRYYIAYDTTSTPCDLNSDYYPFGEIRYRVTQLEGLASLSFTPSMGGYYATFSLDDSGDWVTFRWNQKACTNVASEKALSFYSAFDSIGDAFTIEIDYSGFYSIANFSITQANLETDDYMYANAGNLYSVLDGSPEYFGLDHDPSLSVAQSTFNAMNITSTEWIDTDPLSNSDFCFQYYNGTDWIGQQWDVLTDMIPVGTITDFRIYIYESLELSSIIFSDMHHWRTVDSITMYFYLPEWHVIASAVVIIWMELSTIGLDWFLIFLGLIMIPSSTIYIVKGGRKEASMDKVFFALVAFILGCALFIGGIM